MKRLLMIGGWIAALFFIIIALFSYSSGDCSVLHWNSAFNSTQNAAGFWGSSCADLLRYLFGGGIYGLVLTALYIVVLYAHKRSIMYEIDRIVAALGLVFSYCFFASYYKVDYLWITYSGGIVGLGLNNLLFMLGDTFIVMCGMILFVTANLIVLTSPLIVIILNAIHVIMVSVQNRTALLISRIPLFARMQKMGVLYIHALVKIRQYVCTSFKSVFAPYHNEKWDKELKQLLFTLKTNNKEQRELVAPAQLESSQENTSFYVQNPISAQDNTMHQNSSNVQKRMLIKERSLYILPPVTLFKKDGVAHKNTAEDYQRRAQLLQEKLTRFGINGELTAVRPGPVVTVFEFRPAIDTKVSKIVALEDDLSLALSANSVRILAPIPGSNVVGFEVSNVHRVPVMAGTILHSVKYRESSALLPLILGENTAGDPTLVDLATMPHLLMAGSTGSGKSVALNTMLISLLCKKTPDDMRLILIDPKRLEFAAYADIPHLLFPIVVQPKMALLVLRWVAKLMEERYEKMATVGARNCNDYNALVAGSSNEKMAHVVVVIDELADLLLVAGRDVETVIIRIAQMARAAGIHMIVATQRPSVDVITGLVKVNFPSRISFRVTSRGDSRTILDNCGAERLLGKGDMLFLDAGNAGVLRVHGAYISDEEIKRVVEHTKLQRSVLYLDMSCELETMQAPSDLDDSDDALFQDVICFLKEANEISISLIQRKFRIGFNRSARIIEKLESQGLIMPPDGSKTRKVIR